MRDLVLILLVLILVFIVVFRTFEPSIDIIQTGTNRYRVLLWYNYFEGPDIDRRWIKLCECGKK